MQHVIIGGGPAGLAAAEVIRKHDPAGSIIIISSERELPYARYLLPEFLRGEREKHSLSFRPAEFFSENRIELRMGETVEAVNVKESTVTTTAGQHRYDRLLIATGGRPALPRASLLNVRGVFVLRTLADAHAIDSYLRKENIKETAVVGSGIVGLKVAYMLSRRGIDVSIVEQESRLLPRVLDPDSLVPISRLCWKNGFKILLDERFREFLTSGKEKNVSHLVAYSGRSIQCHAAILCPGVTPVVALAKSIGLESSKGIVVDERMGTSIENIFAAGDAVETMNAATGKTEVMPLWPNALEQGRIAGANMAGRQVTYPGAIWQNSLNVFGLAVVTLGQSHLADKVPGAKVLTSPGLAQGHGVRLVFSGDKLIGVTLLGEVRNADLYKRIIMQSLPAWDVRQELLNENFDSIRPLLI